MLAMVASPNCARRDIGWFPVAHFWKSWGWKLSRKHQKHLISVLATFHAMLVHYHVWVMPRWLEKHSFTCGVNNMASSHMPKIDFRQVACDGLRPPKGTSIAVRCVCYAHETYVCARTKNEAESLYFRASFVPCTEVNHFLHSPSSLSHQFELLAWFGGIWWPANTFTLWQVCFLGHLCIES